MPREISHIIHSRKPAGSPGKTSKAEQAYSMLEEMIITQKLAPGGLLAETDLSKRLGMGRTPVREALQRLEREGLVRIMPRRGVMVSEINVAHQLQQLEVRRVLERLIARCAARRATDEQRQRFLAMAQELQEAANVNDESTFLRLDREFHQRSIEATHNKFLEKVMGLVHGLSRRFWYANQRNVESLKVPAKAHADLMQAIADGDETEAEAKADRLLDYIETFTRATLDFVGDRRT